MELWYGSLCFNIFIFQIPVNVNIGSYGAKFIVVKYLTHVESCRFDMTCKAVTMFAYSQTSIACFW